MYKIKYHYTTGDSFGFEERHETLPYEWETLVAVQESLARIKAHYKVYRRINRSSYGIRDSKERMERLLDVAKKQSWYVEKYDFCLNLVDDKAKDFQMSAPWCGYFECLHSAEIVAPKDKRMRIDFDE